MADDPKRNSEDNTPAEAFDSPTEPVSSGPAAPQPGPSITPDASYRHNPTITLDESYTRVDDTDYTPSPEEASDTKSSYWTWIGLAILLVVIAFFMFR